MLLRSALLCGGVLALLATAPAQAQSAVSISLNGAFGFVFGSGTAEEAIYNAHAQCTERGGTNCTTLVFSEDRGYGAIALSEEEDTDIVIGAGLGFSTPEMAAERALAECIERGGTGCTIAHTWLDAEG